MLKFLLIQLLFIVPVIFYQSESMHSMSNLADSPWPMIKHDPQFTGRSEYVGPDNPSIIWSRDMTNGVFSGPVMDSNENLFFGSYNIGEYSDTFYCYSNIGQQLWQYNLGLGRPPQSGILIDSSNTIYFGSLDEHFYAINPDGTLKWKYKTGHITELLFPNIDNNGRLYITNNPEAELVCLNNDGTLGWRSKYGDGFLEKSPVISPEGDDIYIPGTYENLYSIDTAGRLQWEFECGRINKAPIVDSSGNIYFTCTESPQYFYSLNSEGEINWKTIIQSVGLFNSYSMPTIDKWGNLYFVAPDSTAPYSIGLVSLSNDGKFRWRYSLNDVIGDDVTQPLICDAEGTVYLGSTFGNYYYAISNEGKLKWKLPLNGYQVDNTGAIGKDGTLYLGLHLGSFNSNQTNTIIALKDTLTNIKTEEKLATGFKLNQNYPNPFNPSTIIEYSLDKSGFVEIIMFDILGTEIARPVSEFKSRGEYSLKFDGYQLSSGVYFYSILLGDRVKTRKMLVVK